MTQSEHPNPATLDAAVLDRVEYLDLECAVASVASDLPDDSPLLRLDDAEWEKFVLSMWRDLTRRCPVKAGVTARSLVHQERAERRDAGPELHKVPRGFRLV